MRAKYTVGLFAVAGAGVAMVRRLVGSRPAEQPNRWLAVTVDKSPELVRERLPRELGDLGDRVEVRIQPASGDKGTEIHVRLREPGPNGLAARVAGKDPRQEVRLALRQAKSVLETGEVLRPDPPTAHPGPGGRVVQLASRRAAGEGRL